MTAAPPAPTASTLSKGWFWLTHTPLTVMVVYCLISVYLKENYPFTHYPMYSNPSAERSYYRLADAATGEPIPVAELTDITCPKIGKIWRTKAAELAANARKSKQNLSAEDKQSIGLAIFKQLRGYAKEKGRELPPKLQLSRVDIGYASGKVTETPELLARE